MRYLYSKKGKVNNDQELMQSEPKKDSILWVHVMGVFHYDPIPHESPWIDKF